ncbi:sulfotransferase domain-containing protein [Thermodesulfobacteriota bacterium]
MFINNKPIPFKDYRLSHPGIKENVFKNIYSFIQKNALWKPQILLRYSKAYAIYTLFLRRAFHLRFVITGIPKCGTTWVAKMFESVPFVHIEHEGTELKNELRKRLFDNPSFDFNDPIVSEYLLLFKRQILKNALLNDKSFIGDKTPHMLPEPVKKAFPNARIIFLYRDGRDYVISHTFHRMKKNIIVGDPNDGDFWDERIRQFAPFWNNMVTDVRLRYLDLFGDDFLELRYEDLLTNGVAYVEKMMQFVGINPSFASPAWDSARFEKFSKGRSRGHEDRRSFYRKGIAGDWKNYFSPKNLETFLAITGDTLTELNYKI